MVTHGSTTDYNNDGWVDFISRKRNQADVFRNVAGFFVEGQDLAEASNGNKGAVAFADFDNDGDFDLIWTENGDTQIFEYNGTTFIPLGSATGIPTSFGGNRTDGVVCGDIDNDGDIDIFFAGRQSGMLFINQQNDPVLGANVGAPMTFVQDAATFYNGQGRGCAMVDIDNDGDLDIYVNINNGNNRLFINNLGGASSDNYLFVDIREDRLIANMPAGVERDALEPHCDWLIAMAMLFQAFVRSTAATDVAHKMLHVFISVCLTGPLITTSCKLHTQTFWVTRAANQ